MILAPDVSEVRACFDMQGTAGRRVEKFSVHHIGRRSPNIERRGAETNGTVRHAAMFGAIKRGPYPPQRMQDGIVNARCPYRPCFAAPKRPRSQYEFIQGGGEEQQSAR